MSRTLSMFFISLGLLFESAHLLGLPGFLGNPALVSMVEFFYGVGVFTLILGRDVMLRGIGVSLFVFRISGQVFEGSLFLPGATYGWAFFMYLYGTPLVLALFALAVIYRSQCVNNEISTGNGGC